MSRKMSTPRWQRVICGLLAAAGAAALVGNVWGGLVHGIWGVATWVCALGGIIMFGRFAVQKPTVYREVNDLPAPSAQVAGLIEEHRQLDAIKMYRAQATASLCEARAVIAHYWPDPLLSEPRAQSPAGRIQR